MVLVAFATPFSPLNYWHDLASCRSVVYFELPADFERGFDCNGVAISHQLANKRVLRHVAI
jgi:hypothetical protein